MNRRRSLLVITGKTKLYFPIFHFLLPQSFAGDEASTRLLQILLFLLLSIASLMFIPCAVGSSFSLSIHFLGYISCCYFAPLVRTELVLAYSISLHPCYVSEPRQPFILILSINVA